MAHDHRFRFAAQLSTTPGDGPVMGRPGPAGRRPRVLSAAHARPLRGPTGPGPGAGRRGWRHPSLKMGSLVFGNDYRHPVVLAKEAATLDVLSDGRFELSLGAGWMRTDYEEAGIPYDTPKVRVERFEEAVQVIQGLLRTDGPFSFDGTYYHVTEHTLRPDRSSSRALRSSSAVVASGCSPSPPATPTSSASTSISGREPGGRRRRRTPHPNAPERRWPGS